MAARRAGEHIAERFALVEPLTGYGLGEAWYAKESTNGAASYVVKFLGVGALGDETDPRSLHALCARQAHATASDALPLRACGQHDGQAWVALDRFDARTLASWIAGHRAAHTRPALATAQRIVDRVAEGIEVMRGLTGVSAHAALSPASVLFRFDAQKQHEVRVLDYGLARFAIPVDGGEVLLSQYRTPGANDEEPTVADDVFALAVLACEVLSPARTGHASWWSVRPEEGPRALRTLIGGLRDDVPGVVCDVLARALSRDASVRPASVAELRANLHDRWRRAGLWEKAPPTPEEDVGVAPEVAASVGLLRTCYAEAVTAPVVPPSAFNEVTPPAAMALPVLSVDDAAPTWVAHVSNPVPPSVEVLHERTSVDVVLPEHDLGREPSVDALPDAIFGPTEVGAKVPSDLAAMARESVRARTRTLGLEEVSSDGHPPFTEVQESTRMLEVSDWGAPPSAPRASGWSDTPGDPFAHAVSEPTRAIDLEPTRAIDLSTSGAFVTPQHPAFHPQPHARIERHEPSALPPAPWLPPQVHASRRPVWIIAVLLVVFVLLAMAVIAALS